MIAVTFCHPQVAACGQCDLIMHADDFAVLTRGKNAGKRDHLCPDCRDYARQIKRRYVAANRECVRATQRRYYNATREAERARKRDYAQAHRERLNAYMREYRRRRRQPGVASGGEDGPTCRS